MTCCMLDSRVYQIRTYLWPFSRIFVEIIMSMEYNGWGEFCFVIDNYFLSRLSNCRQLVANHHTLCIRPLYHIN